uniref:Uncharacterized protein n=1 Tax=Rhizophagus irregularis (strain DAOM 181602 / DAOM 197198 / MUCL 43194) TaxID=747089 RepID=U9UZL3_RHIID
MPKLIVPVFLYAKSLKTDGSGALYVKLRDDPMMPDWLILTISHQSATNRHITDW